MYWAKHNNKFHFKYHLLSISQKNKGFIFKNKIEKK